MLGDGTAPALVARFEALETIEFDACSDLYRAAPRDLQVAHAIEARQVGSATCLTSLGIDPATLFRRAVGLGVAASASEADLDAVIAYMNGRGARYAVPVAPGSRPAEFAAWLERRGFERGYAWMKFHRPCGDAPETPCALDIRSVGSESHEQFGRVVAEGFGLPPAVAPWMGSLAGRESWICVMAFAGATPVAAGAAYVSGEYAWLGFGATLEKYRRLGAQNALLARRLEEAAARGARVAVTETGERLPDKPSNSYRNILRAGFQEAYLRQNFLSPPV